MPIGPYHHHQKRSCPGSQVADTAAIKLHVTELRKSSISLLEKLPSLTEIVVATDRRSRLRISNALSDCQSALVAEGEALEATRKCFSSPEWRTMSQEFQQRKGYVNDLAARAAPLFLHGATLPVEVPITSKAQIAELLEALHHYREIFWKKLYEVPGVQRVAIEQLQHVLTTGGQPSSVLHWASAKQPDEEALRRDLSEVVATVVKVLATQPSASEKATRAGEISSILMRVPLDAEVLSERVVALRAAATELADLEIALTCDHGGVRSKDAKRDSRFSTWQELCAEFGGGAIEARAIVAEVEKAQEPYVRIKQYLTTANLPFVLKVLKGIGRFQPLMGDMVQEGAMGFMRALDKFDSKSGYALLTYAGYWVRQRASRGYDRQSSAIYLPDRLRMPLEKLTQELAGELRNDPVALAKKIRVTDKELAALRPLVVRAASLESPIQGTSIALSETIPTPTSEGDTSQHDFNLLQERIAAALKILPARQRTVVIRCFGLDGDEPQTLVAVGKELGITKEGVRQLRNRAVEKLRNGRFGAELARLMEDMKE